MRSQAVGRIIGDQLALGPTDSTDPRKGYRPNTLAGIRTPGELRINRDRPNENIVNVIYYRQTEFNTALRRLARSGGTAQQAARRVREIVGTISTGASHLSEVGKLTKHGESPDTKLRKV